MSILTDVPAGQVASMIRSIRSIRDLKNDEIASILGCSVNRVANILACNTAPTHSEISVFELFLTVELEEYEKRFLIEKHYPHLNLLRAQISFDRAIDGLAVANSHWDSQIINKMCNYKNTRYLNIRVGESSKIIIASMIIKPSKGITPPSFITHRRSDLGSIRKVKGLIFGFGESQSIYTVGRLERGEGLRFSRLKIIPVNKSSDLCGIRLGFSQSSNLPHAHRIYCSKFDDRYSGVDSRSVIGVHSSDRLGFLRDHIPQIDNIVELLKFENAIENGIVAKYIS